MPAGLSFESLEFSSEGRRRRAVGFVCGLAVDCLAVGLWVLGGALFPYQPPPEASYQYSHITLPSLATPEKPAVKEPRAPTRIARLVVPKLEHPRSAKLPTAVPAVAPHLEPPKIQAKLPQPPLPQPQPRETRAFSVARVNPAPKVPVHTGLFGGGKHLATLKRPVEEVQTGGFGNPQGLAGQAQGGNPGNVPKLGSFDLPSGPGNGNGTGGSHGSQGTVASAGFGDGIAASSTAPGAGSSGDPPVSTGGFDKTVPVAPSGHARTAAPPAAAAAQPVEILSKPSPIYTDEARRLGIQGEVVLSVIFQAGGTIKVVGVVKSLGHGLDQAAEQAASQIRFKPAQRFGRAVDSPATLRIEFRLA